MTGQEVILWCHLDKLSQEVMEHLSQGDINVETRDYENSLKDLTEWISFHPEANKILIPKPSMYLSGASYAVYSAIPVGKSMPNSSPLCKTVVYTLNN